MKLNILIAVAVFGCVFFTSGREDDKAKTKAMRGKWCNPYTYESTGVMKGFNLKKGGKGESINVPVLRYDSWEVKNGVFIIKGERTNPDGTKEVYLREERIGKLTKDSVELIVREDDPRIAFLYVRPKVAEKAYGKKIEKETEVKSNKLKI